MKMTDRRRGGKMLPKGLEKPYAEIYRAVFEDGMVDGKHKVLVAMAVAGAIGCYP
jgi:hypothetical protein